MGLRRIGRGGSVMSWFQLLTSTFRASLLQAGVNGFRVVWRKKL
jgi:hypothetical protein